MAKEETDRSENGSSAEKVDAEIARVGGIEEILKNEIKDYFGIVVIGVGITKAARNLGDFSPTQLSILLQARGVRFANAPPEWDIGAAIGFDNNGNPVIILPEDVTAETVAHEILDVLIPQLTHKENLLLAKRKGNLKNLRKDLQNRIEQAQLGLSGDIADRQIMGFDYDVENYHRRVEEIISKLNLSKKESSFEHLSIINTLLELGQIHLFEGWDALGVNDEAKVSFLDQLIKMDADYPGGLAAYRANGIKLLEASAKEENPFDGYIPKVPQGVELTTDHEQLLELQSKGLEVSGRLAVVLAAGGLGERLGYDGIKLSIPIDLVTATTYLECYINSIITFQESSNRLNNEDRRIPFVIMTSNDTDAMTKEALEDLSFIRDEEAGYARYSGRGISIYIVKQGAVPAITNNQGDFCLKEGNLYSLQAKPHGHGDVHKLLYQSGLVDSWVEQGITHTVFIQDTNAQVFNAVLAGLAVSIERGFDFNFLTAPREAAEAVGAVTELVHKNGTSMICNVEYNQLDPVLKATVNPEGDVLDPKTGKSPYPGNLNIIIVKNTKYKQVLDQTKGIVAESVNPKYTDDTRATFKKPTRLETFMQDIAKVFGESSVSFTNFEKRDVFSPVKNNIEVAAENPKNGNYPDSMATGEADHYKYFRKLLAQAGVDIDIEGNERTSWGVPYQEGAKVVLSPDFAMTEQEVINKVTGGTISDRSTLIVDGQDITIENLQLDGTLIIKTAPGVKLTVKDLKVSNKGWRFVDLTEEEMNDSTVPTYLKIRGYKLVKDEEKIIEITEPGEHKEPGRSLVKSVRVWVLIAALSLFTSLSILAAPQNTAPAGFYGINAENRDGTDS
ncbi:MAG: UTP--glucose-1-phosphate uridylyltransferase, partial [Nitrospirota bacterium]